MLNLDIAKFNPYVRYVSHLEGSRHETHIMPWRILYDFEMIFVTKGALEVFTDCSEYRIEEGCLHLMPPFLKHTRRVPEETVTNYYNVHFDFFFEEEGDFSAIEIYKKPCELKLRQVPIRENLVNRRVDKPEIISVVESYQVRNPVRFVSLFQSLVENWSGKDEESAMRVKADMILLMAEFMADLRRSAQGGAGDLVGKFMDYIMNHYAESLDLNDLVKDYGISPSRFRAIFKTKTNKAPHEFVIEYRMEQAKRLLLSQKYTVSEVSYMVGYDDIHYFSRLFKQKTGVNPSEFLPRGK